MGKIVVILALSGLVLSPLATAADPVPDWDPEKTTALAAQLAVGLENVRNVVRREPIIVQNNRGQNRAASQLLDTLKALTKSANRLSRQLSAGEGRAGTESTMKRIDLLLRDAQVQLRRLDKSLPVQQAIAPVVTQAKELRQFYGLKPPGPAAAVDPVSQSE